MIIPLMIAGAVWTYNIVKIIERASGGEDEREDNGSEGNTLTNSIDAIRYIRQLKHIERIEEKRAHEGAYYRQ